MKNSMKKVTKILAILVAVVVVTSSCSKSTARKNIAGTWIIDSITQNGVDPYTSQGATYNGNYTFGECSSSDNEDGLCTGTFALTVFFQGSSSSWDDIFNYQILDKGEMMAMGGDIMLLDVDDNNMTLSSDDGETVIRMHK